MLKVLYIKPTIESWWTSIFVLFLVCAVRHHCRVSIITSNLTCHAISSHLSPLFPRNKQHLEKVKQETEVKLIIQTPQRTVLFDITKNHSHALLYSSIYFFKYMQSSGFHYCMMHALPLRSALASNDVLRPTVSSGYSAPASHLCGVFMCWQEPAGGLLSALVLHISLVCTSPYPMHHSL